MRRRLLPPLMLPLLAAWLASQAMAQTAAPAPTFPDVVAVKLRAAGTDRFDFDVTVSSPYGSLDGKVIFGERKLWHDHAGEQPFTRDLHGVAIPPGPRQVRVQARDQQHGYGGRAMDVTLPGR